MAWRENLLTAIARSKFSRRVRDLFFTQQYVAGSVTERNERVRTRHARHRAGEAIVDEQCQDRFGDVARAPALIDHEHTSGNASELEDVALGQRRDEAKVEHADGESLLTAQTVDGCHRQRKPISVGQQRNLGVFRGIDAAAGKLRGLAGVRGEPVTVAFIRTVAAVIQRDRFDHDHATTLALDQIERRAIEGERVVGARRYDHYQTRDVSQYRK